MLRSLLFFVVIVTTNSITVFSQLFPPPSFKVGEFEHPVHKPRTKKNYDKVGFYQIAVSLNKSILYPGDNFVAKAFFTGYGMIGMSKVTVYPSKADIFDSASNILHSFGVLGNQFIWGKDTLSFGDQPYILNISGGLQFFDTSYTTFYINGQPNYKESDTSFFDSYVDFHKDPKNMALLTELELVNSPITFNLKLKDNVEPGNYKINFYYTYFNGEEWVGSSETAEFKVNSFREQYDTILTVAALIVGIISILPLFMQGLKFLLNIFFAEKKISTIVPGTSDPATPNNRRTRKTK